MTLSKDMIDCEVLRNGPSRYVGDIGDDEIPEIPGLDAKILERIESGAGTLDMDDWHSCDTTHCIAGWAVTLGGFAGAVLETRVGPACAGALIYLKSTGRIPCFYDSDENAMLELRKRVEES